MAKTYARADTYSIEELKENIREMKAEKAARDARIEELEPLAAEHAELVSIRDHEGQGTNCLAAMRGMLGVRLMKRELGEPD